MSALETPRAIFHCATCGSFGPDERSNPIGTPFECPKDPNHVAAVVKPSVGPFWLNVEKYIRKLQSASPLRWMAKGGRAGLYHGLRAALLVVLLGIAQPDRQLLWRILVMAMSTYFLYDIVLLSSYATFISRDPAHPLRSLLLNLSSFFQISLVYAVYYEFLARGFDHLIDPLDAWYFSVITITTVGYGDIHVVGTNLNGRIAQLLIISELVIGLYVLSGLVAVVASWANDRPEVQPRKTLAELRGKPRDSQPSETTI